MAENITHILKSLDDNQLRVLSAEAIAELRERDRKIDLNDITPDRLRDPEFARQVRAEVERTLSEL